MSKRISYDPILSKMRTSDVTEDEVEERLEQVNNNFELYLSHLEQNISTTLDTKKDKTTFGIKIFNSTFLDIITKNLINNLDEKHTIEYEEGTVIQRDDTYNIDNETAEAEYAYIYIAIPRSYSPIFTMNGIIGGMYCIGSLNLPPITQNTNLQTEDGTVPFRIYRTDNPISYEDTTYIQIYLSK